MEKGPLMPYEGFLLEYNQDGWGTIKLQKLRLSNLLVHSHFGRTASSYDFQGVEEGTGKEVEVKIVVHVTSDFETNREFLERRAALDSPHVWPLVSFQNWNSTTWVLLYDYPVDLDPPV